MWTWLTVLGLLVAVVAVDAIVISGCDIEMHEEGSVTSENYPGPYPTNEGKCTIKVYAPLSHTVSLTLTYLDTKPSPGGKCNKKSDNLAIFDGPSTKSSKFPELARWCGDIMPVVTTVETSQNVATIMFRTHDIPNNPYTGFRIEVSFNGDCGQSKYPDAGSMPLAKIIGGIDARPHEFPWMAYITWDSSQLCGGSIINKNWVLTAGHCVFGYLDPSPYEVRVHVHNRTDEGADFQSFVPSAIFLHPNYFEGDVPYFDIALMKVSDITFNDEVQPICMPDPDDTYAGRKSGTSGWGTIDAEVWSPPDVLMYTTVEVLTNAVCKPFFPNSWVKPNMVCATDELIDPDRDACQGDSGGPIFVQEDDDRFTCIGITSWGISCAGTSPGVYARLSSFLNWVQDTISQN